MAEGDSNKITSVEKTNLEGAESGFVAPPEVRDGLQQVVVDMISLQLAGKQAHWNIVGPNFRDLHLNLDEVVDIARDGGDELAERLRALHSTVDGRVETVANTSTLPQFKPGEIHTHEAINLIVEAIETVVRTMREVHDPIDAADPTTADLLHEYIAKLEQQAWLVSSETRTPSA